MVVVPPPRGRPCPPPTETRSSQTFDHSFYVTKVCRRTPVGCLRRDYEDRLRPNCHYAMKDEFERVPSGPTDTADEARSPHNAPLNRSQDALPYDKNRVRSPIRILRRKTITPTQPNIFSGDRYKYGSPYGTGPLSSLSPLL